MPTETWGSYRGLVAIHDRRGCWLLQGEAPAPEELGLRGPDVRTPGRVNVVHTICAGDAAHGGLLLGLMLHGMGRHRAKEAARLSQACALTVVEPR